MNHLTETWRAVKNYKGIYEVSNLGRVKRIRREIKNIGLLNKSKKCILKELILKPCNQGGYLKCSLKKNGKGKNFLVHRLVAQAFIKNPLNKLQVNHKFGIRNDNRASQLEWCTNFENMQHSWKNEYRNNNHFNKKVIQFFNGRLIKVWKSRKEAVKCTKLKTPAGISACCCGTQKTSAGFQWKNI